jgi:hypothetical protein
MHWRISKIVVEALEALKPVACVADLEGSSTGSSESHLDFSVSMSKLGFGKYALPLLEKAVGISPEALLELECCTGSGDAIVGGSPAVIVIDPEMGVCSPIC